jgi:hypothetical protein
MCLPDMSVYETLTQEELVAIVKVLLQHPKEPQNITLTAPATMPKELTPVEYCFEYYTKRGYRLRAVVDGYVFVGPENTSTLVCIKSAKDIIHPQQFMRYVASLPQYII